MKNKTRYNIELIGLQIAVESGVESVNFQSIADRVGVTRQAVAHYFENLDDLRASIEAAAIAHNVIPVVAQAITGPRATRYPVTAATLADVSAFIMSRGA